MSDDSHDHHHHHHHGDADVVMLRRAFLLTTVFLVVELIAGLWTNALVLIADAGHMLLDSVALGLAWWAAHISARGQDERLSYGYHRFQVLAAFVNGLTLAALVVWIAIEASYRLLEPEPMIPLPALAVACLGFIVNLVAFRWLHQGSGSTNLRSAALHVLGDLLGSAAAIMAALAVYLFDWLYADPVLTLLIVAILGRGAYRVLKESTHILLEGVPKGVDLNEIKSGLTHQVSGVVQIHHVHAWGLTAEKPLLTLHALVHEGTGVQRVITEIKRVLRDTYQIEHSTIQVEVGPCPDD